MKALLLAFTIAGIAYPLTGIGVARRIEADARLRHERDSLAAAADSAQAEAERDAAWAKREVWAHGFTRTRMLNAEQALRMEREKCGSW